MLADSGLWRGREAGHARELKLRLDHSTRLRDLAHWTSRTVAFLQRPAPRDRSLDGPPFRSLMAALSAIAAGPRLDGPEIDLALAIAAELAALAQSLAEDPPAEDALACTEALQRRWRGIADHIVASASGHAAASLKETLDRMQPANMAPAREKRHVVPMPLADLLLRRESH
ncbi:hypothetical protein GT347_23340 [Xylophilus rhododendri]|uniref:Uncharacterized protein n=1 Tax=Xylophilus rhododendri TaxID=2697032 RepID=A0A857JC40_9BURK|nr:hypothetical protein [Xylophilus rhododendri]QHJ00660.1 hypothetical protein GT347_23340 [Xylophilus rhododendri]